MTWLVENLNKEFDVNTNTDKILNALQQENIDHKLVTTVPFEHVFFEYVETEKPNFIYGSTLTIKAAKKYGYDDALYVAPTESEVRNNIGNMYLNHDMEVLHTDSVLDYVDEMGYEFFFIKPNTDLKSFDGTVVDSNKFPYFMETAMSRKNYNKNEKICVSGIKNIEKEWRVFIVDGFISTYSQYMVDRKLDIKWSIDNEAINLVYECIERYNTQPIMVIDICKTDTGYYVIEYNTPNCSGLYGCDVNKLVKDIEDY